jgi:uncharacterized protein YsxB (DUF464 family)
MTEVRVQRAGDGSVAGVEASGHSGYAQSGEDIVCAAISALVVTALIGLKRVAKHPHQGSASSGRMYCKLLPGGTSESFMKAQAVLETTVLGLKDIAKDYPQFLRVMEGG